MSYTCLHYHIVFATKDRQPFLNEKIKDRLIKYLKGIIQHQDGKAYVINGPEDHLHLLVSIPAATSVATMLREIKGGSSKWVHETFPECKDFAWQDGYSAFTVSYSGIDDVCRYIMSQQEHHQRVDYLDELKQFLDVHQIEYDPKYLR